jgi:hypothetical protein
MLKTQINIFLQKGSKIRLTPIKYTEIISSKKYL